MTPAIALPSAPRATETADAPRRILLVDDHPITRQGLKALIAPHGRLTVCGEADSADAAVELTRKFKPHLVVLDISLPTGNAIDIVERIKASSEGVHVLVMSMYDESLFAERAIRAGASGYLMKQEASEKLIQAITKILSGQIFLSAPMTAKLLDHSRKSGAASGVSAMDTLSAREKEVFDLMGEGFSTRAIAEKLGLSIKTIDSYREHLKLKLGLSTGAELVQFAIKWSNAAALASPSQAGWRPLSAKPYPAA